MIKVDSNFVDQISAKAKTSARRRMNFNYHKQYDDTLQRLLNAVEPYSYIQPHKHEDPNKREIFFLLKGSVLVVEFDDLGNIADHVVLSVESGNLIAEIAERTWHCIFALEPSSVVYEFKDGPYVPVTDKNFATWAPKEGDSNCNEYIDTILNKLNLHIKST